MSFSLRVGVNGAAGRMGQSVVSLVSKTADLKLIGAYEVASSPAIGQDAGLLAGVGDLGVPVTSDVVARPDVIIDFSTPAGAAAIAAVCAERKIPLVVATTGLHGKDQQEVIDASQVTAVLQSPSMSLAVNVTMKLVADAARMFRSLKNDADVEILERHHRRKEDAPSGTALKFGAIVAREMGQTDHAHGRTGRPGAKPTGQIGYHAIRTGDNVGEHTILFGMPGETVELTVKSLSRECYAHGAIAAARFIAQKTAGLYSMEDVLGL